MLYNMLRLLYLQENEALHLPKQWEVWGYKPTSYYKNTNKLVIVKKILRKPGSIAIQLLKMVGTFWWSINIWSTYVKVNGSKQYKMKCIQMAWKAWYFPHLFQLKVTLQFLAGIILCGFLHKFTFLGVQLSKVIDFLQYIFKRTWYSTHNL